MYHFAELARVNHTTKMDGASRVRQGASAPGKDHHRPQRSTIPGACRSTPSLHKPQRCAFLPPPPRALAVITCGNINASSLELPRAIDFETLVATSKLAMGISFSTSNINDLRHRRIESLPPEPREPPLRRLDGHRPEISMEASGLIRQDSELNRRGSLAMFSFFWLSWEQR